MLRLTARGWMFVGAGLVATAVGLLISQRDALRLGVLLLLVPLLSAALLQFTPAAVRARRRVEPEHVRPQTRAAVRLQILNPSTAWTRVLLATDAVPAGLGQAPRFAVDRLPPGGDVTVTYQLGGAARGVYPIGPLQYRVGDALGMAERRWTYPGTDKLIVLPQVHRLDAVEVAVTAHGRTELGETHLRTSGDVDVSTREYRHGDDLRRVHWPSTARHGELMVRREEQADSRLATVLLDARPADAGDSDRLEWTISAAASICEHLAGRGIAVRLLTHGVDHAWVWPDDQPGRQQHLVRLAMLESEPAYSFAEAVQKVVAQSADDLVVAVLSGADTDKTTAQALRRPGWACVTYRSGMSMSSAWREAVHEWQLRTA